jgi:hypothetical protein
MIPTSKHNANAVYPLGSPLLGRLSVNHRVQSLVMYRRLNLQSVAVVDDDDYSTTTPSLICKQINVYCSS